MAEKYLRRNPMPEELQAAQGQHSRADIDNYYTRREQHGPIYQVVPSRQRQEGDPTWRARGVPPDAPPSLVELLMTAPRALPVPQTIEHGPEESRIAAFNDAEQEQYARAYRGFEQVLSLADMHHHAGLGRDTGLGPWKFNDRRRQGRRIRPTFNGDDQASVPYPPAPHGSEIPFERFLRGF
jgi:hypothetical protein